jgi:glucan phosphorylase
MAGGRTYACCRSSHWASAGGNCSPRSVFTPKVCHLNEGHAAFAVLERARVFMQQSGQPFDVALTVTRAGNLFTTHTAVAAGFDRYDPARIEHCLGGYAEQKLHIAVRVELYAEGVGGGAPAAVEMISLKQEANAHVYTAQVPATRPPADYTARLTPFFPGVASVRCMTT